MAGILSIFMWILGIGWIAVGVLMVFATGMAKEKILSKILNAKIKSVGIIPIVVGVILLLAAGDNRHTLFVTLLGILAIVKGVMCIVATEKMEKIRDWWLKADDKVYKISGAVVAVMGSIVLMGI